MASAEFLEQALSTDVDEKAVNAIVGSLENQLIPSDSSASTQINLGIHQRQTASTKFGSSSKISGLNNVNSADNSTSAPYNNVQGTAASTSLTLTGTVPSEPLKVISTQNQTLSNHNNRVTFPAQPTPTGCIATQTTQRHSGYPPDGSVDQRSGTVNTTTMQTPLVIKQGAPTGQVGMQQGIVTVPMSVNSSMPTSIPNVMTLSKPGGQNVVVTTQNLGSAQPTIIPNVQILNMRPGAPNVAAQKSVATVSPRVVIGTPQVVGTRAAAPGITLQTLQSLQQGQQGHLLLKTENGQYQLLRVGPAPAPSTLTAPQAQTIRLSTVPAHPGVATVSTSMAVGGPMPAAPHATPVPMSSSMSGSMAGSMSSSMTAPTPGPSTPIASSSVQQSIPPPHLQQPVSTHIKPSDNTKEKCRNFLANLLDLSSKEPPSVEMNVRNLIQELIDAQVEPEEFCDRLERLLNASPQPCLIGFLKKSLPLLRQSLVTKELVIEGINPPMPHVAFSAMQAPPQSLMATSSLQMPDDEEGPSPSATLTTLLPPVLPLGLAPPHSHPIASGSGPDPELMHGLPPGAKCINLVSLEQYAAQQKAPGKGTIAVLQNIPVHTKLNVSKMGGKTMTVNSKGGFVRGGGGPGGSAAALSTVLTPGKSLLKDKEKKTAQFAGPFGDDKMAGDDDINDVAAMGGVNLAEETQRILGSTEMIGTQIRSCKEELLVSAPAMAARVRAASLRCGLEEPGPAAERDLAALLSHAVQERLKTLVEKLACIAQHRIDPVMKSDPRYETTQDVKGQLKFLEELDRVDKKRREDSERELLLRAAKSRSKNEDPEQAKLKAKAKEMQRAELEELRQREANLTALQAIGPRKKPRPDGPGQEPSCTITSAQAQQQPAPGPSGRGRSQVPMRTRMKRVNLRDMLFMMEQDHDYSHSELLFRTYLK